MNNEEVEHLMQSYYNLHKKYYKIKYENQKLRSKLDEIRKFVLSFDYYIPEDDKNDLLEIIYKGEDYE